MNVHNYRNNIINNQAIGSIGHNDDGIHGDPLDGGLGDNELR